MEITHLNRPYTTSYVLYFAKIPTIIAIKEMYIGRCPMLLYRH